MNKRLILVVVAVLIVVAAIVGVPIAKQHNKALPTNIAQAKAMDKSNAPACRTDNAKQLKLSSAAQQSVELAVIGQLMDVPAGTNVDVRINTYDSTKVTGSDIYASNYGSYNFTATRSSEKTDWHVTEFVACE